MRHLRTTTASDAGRAREETRMQTSHVLVIATALGAALLRPAVAAGATLPAAVQKELKALEAVCTEVGGTPRSAKAVTEVDLTADGTPDWVVAVEAIDCEGAPSVYGDRAKGVTIFVGDGAGGAAQGFTGAAYGVKLEGAKVWLTVAGDECGAPPAKDFASERFCERALVWNAATKRLELAPVSSVRMVE